MKKKGFTLIELLAVIVVLAIIALIAVPMILNIIESAKKGAFRDSVYGLERAAELYTVKSDYNKDEKLEFICNGKTCETSDGKKLNFKGEVPISGSVIVENNIITINYIKNNSYCALGTRENLDIQKDCTKLDITPAELNIESSKVSSNSILVRIMATDIESGIKRIEYFIDGKSRGSEDKKLIGMIDETYLFEDLDKNTEYEIKIKATNGNNKETEKMITIKTEEIGNPSITYTNTPTDSIDGYLEKQVINVEFNNSNITTPSNYIKTTRKGISSLNVTESCGTGTEPGTCTSITDITTLDINTWYKVSGDVKVTYSEPSDIAGTLYAITYDGRNYGGASTGVISKIDTAGPVISLSKTTSKTDSLIVSYSITDKVGIKSTTCKYGETVGTYDKTGSATNTSCILTGLDDDKTYYYQVCSTDMLGINGNCVTGNSKTELVNNPNITYTNTPTDSINGYLERQVINVAFNNSNITTPTYYIKTTRKGTSSLNVTASCGTGTEPGTCTNITSTNTLDINTWYKVSGDVKVTYSEVSDIAGTLYAITYDGKNYSGASTGVISKIIEPVTGISLDRTSATLERGSTLGLNATISPNNATNKTVTWTSSNTSVATVDGNGLVTSRGAGNVTITATTYNGKSATCNITVIVSPNGISLDRTSASIENGQNLQLYATVSPGDSTNKIVTWTSNNTSVATVDGNGLVTSRGVGNVTITATTSNGISASANVTVTLPVYLLSTQVQVGDYVAYDAGTWTSSATLQAGHGNFGGYTAGQNKANSVNHCSLSWYTTNLKGWRVLKIVNNQVYLVHAGHPECYYHGNGYGYESPGILNSRVRAEYLNTTYAEKAYNITKDEALAIAESNDLRKIGSPYWLSTAANAYNLTLINYAGTLGSDINSFYGVRPVIVLKSGVKTSGRVTDAVGNANAWNLIAP